MRTTNLPGVMPCRSPTGEARCLIGVISELDMGPGSAASGAPDSWVHASNGKLAAAVIRSVGH